MATYMKDLLFQRDSFGRYIGSPYDNFLRVNHLPGAPLAGETKAAYNLRLAKAGSRAEESDLHHEQGRLIQVPLAALSVWRAGVSGAEDISCVCYSGALLTPTPETV